MQISPTGTAPREFLPPRAEGCTPHIPGAWRADVQRTYSYMNGGKLRRLLNCARAAGVQAILVLRFGQWIQTKSRPVRSLLGVVYFILNGLVKILWGIEIPRAVRIGPGLYIGHFGGITVAPGVTIGSNCTLSQSITLGAWGGAENHGAPVIGDNTYIAPGARLFGKITVGNNVKIGANAVIYKNVPDNAIVALSPGFQIISLKGNLPEVTARTTRADTPPTGAVLRTAEAGKEKAGERRRVCRECQRARLKEDVPPESFMHAGSNVERRLTPGISAREARLRTVRSRD
jgi:serine O-acetyltransferase